MKSEWLVLALFLLLLALPFSYVMLPVKGQTSQTRDVNITSPIENQTCQSNIVPLEFTINLSGIESFAIKNNLTIQGLVLNCALDGQQGYHAPQHIVGIGESHELYPPFQSNYSTTLNLPNGNHTLWVSAAFWIVDSYGNHQPIEELSQFVKFAVEAPNPSTSTIPSQTPTVPEVSWLIILSLLLSVFSVAVVLRHRKLVMQH
jgi:hypothetical protein